MKQRNVLIFFGGFILMFVLLYFFWAKRSVSIDMYKKINITYSLEKDSLVGDKPYKTMSYIFVPTDSTVKIVIQEPEKRILENRKFYDFDFFQWIAKSIQNNSEIPESRRDTLDCNLSYTDTLGVEHYYLLRQEKINELIDNYFNKK